MKVPARKSEVVTLRKLRTAAGFTQARLASVAKVRAATISDIERGVISRCSYGTVVGLANALGRTSADVYAAIAASGAGR